MPIHEYRCNWCKGSKKVVIYSIVHSTWRFFLVRIFITSHSWKKYKIDPFDRLWVTSYNNSCLNITYYQLPVITVTPLGISIPVILPLWGRWNSARSDEGEIKGTILPAIKAWLWFPPTQQIKDSLFISVAISFNPRANSQNNSLSTTLSLYSANCDHGSFYERIYNKPSYLPLVELIRQQQMKRQQPKPFFLKRPDLRNSASEL